MPQLANVLCLSLSHPLFFSSQGCSWYLAFSLQSFCFLTAVKEQHCGHDEVVTHLHVCLSGDANTVLSSVMSALQAAVPAAMGAGLHPTVPGDTASLVSVTRHNPAAVEQQRHSLHGKTQEVFYYMEIILWSSTKRLHFLELLLWLELIPL